MKKVLSIVLSFALVFGLLIGVQVKPVKVEGAVESMYFEATPKLDRVKLNWYKEKKVSKFIIYRADVTKLGDRDGIYMLCDGSEVIWVPGLRIGERYKVSEKTKNIWKVERKDNG